MVKIWVIGFLTHFGLLGLLNRRGEAGSETYTKEQVEAMIAEKTKGALPQDKVDAIVQDRLARERVKYADYEDLRKFKAEHQKQAEEKNLKELEAQKEFEKAKEAYEKKIAEFGGKLTEKDNVIKDMAVRHTLMNEIVKHNAYPEETMALLKQQAVFEGEAVRIKGKDANGIDIVQSVEEGVKQFLSQRPHLVKAINPNGGGTPPGAGGGAGVGAGADDLNSLNKQLMEARNRGDNKTANEVSLKMRAMVGARRAML